MKTWIKHFAQIRHKLMIIEVIEQAWESKKIGNKKKNLKRRVVSVIKMKNPVPKREYKVKIGHFDSTAFQSDDREFTSESIQIEPDRDICKSLMLSALTGYNTEPKELTLNQ